MSGRHCNCETCKARAALRSRAYRRRLKLVKAAK